MRSIFATILFSLFLGASPRYYIPVIDNGFIKYINTNGDIILKTSFKSEKNIKDIFSNVFLRFNENVATIKYDDDLFLFFSNQEYCIIDTLGNILVEPNYLWIGQMKEGLAPILISKRFVGIKYGEKFGYIDKNESIIIPAIFDYADPFSEGLAKVVKRSKTGFINKKGVYEIKPKYKNASSFSGGLASVLIKDKYGYIDKTDRMVIKPRFDQVRPFKHGYAIVMIDQKYNIIDKEGNTVFENGNEFCGTYSEGYAVVEKNGLYGYIDTTLNFSIVPQFNYARKFSEKLSAVKIDSMWGFIDYKGKIIIEPKYFMASDFRDGVAIVFEDDEMNYINIAGDKIWTLFKNDSSAFFIDSYFKDLEVDFKAGNVGYIWK